MKRILATCAVTLAMIGSAPVPASAHIEHGINCHINRPQQLSNHRVRIVLRMTNRTQNTQTLACQVKIVTTTHFRRDWTTRVVDGRRFIVVRYIRRIPGDLDRAKITHGHIV